jgi:hypothetical protein
VRFISKSAKFSLQVRPMVVEAFASGVQRIAQEPIYVDFQLHRLRPEEREFALTQFYFEGNFQEQDEVTMTAPDHRLSLFDTDEAARDRGWTADEKAHVEEMLLSHSTRFTDIVAVPVKVLLPPWPNYDEYHAPPEALLRKLVDEGYDLEEVLAYERVNQDREPIIEVLEQALAEINEGEVVEEVIG